MAPNTMNLIIRFGSTHGPKPYEFIWFGSMHGPRLRSGERGWGECKTFRADPKLQVSDPKLEVSDPKLEVLVPKLQSDAAFGFAPSRAGSET